MFRRFGADVTIVEKAPRLIAREDEDVSESLRQILEAEGLRIRTGAECISLTRHADGVAVGVDCREGPPEAIGSHVLLAVGRRPNSDDLGLDRAGVAVDAHGYVMVDDTLATNVPGSGRLAIATVVAPSRTRPTTISRSWPRTCWTGRTGTSARGFRAMRSTPIRRSGAPA